MARKSRLKRGVSTAGLVALAGGGVLGIIVAVLVVGFVAAIPAAWLLMVLIGVLHSLVPAVPAFGFWVSYIIVVIVNLLFSRPTSSSR